MLNKTEVDDMTKSLMIDIMVLYFNIEIIDSNYIAASVQHIRFNHINPKIIKTCLKFWELLGKFPKVDILFQFITYSETSCAMILSFLNNYSINNYYQAISVIIQHCFRIKERSFELNESILDFIEHCTLNNYDFSKFRVQISNLFENLNCEDPLVDVKKYIISKRNNFDSNIFILSESTSDLMDFTDY